MMLSLAFFIINKSAKLVNSMQGIILVTQTITVITVLNYYLIVTCVHILFEVLILFEACDPRRGWVLGIRKRNHSGKEK